MFSNVNLQSLLSCLYSLYSLCYRDTKEVPDEYFEGNHNYKHPACLITPCILHVEETTPRYQVVVVFFTFLFLLFILL